MTECNFYSPEDIRPLYDEIVPAYQAAFADEPWYEVSKCADKQQRCVGGLSALAIGQTCELCSACPRRPAYEPAELVERFNALADSRPTAWYTERSERGLTLAAIAWEAPATMIAAEKYTDVPAMNSWLSDNLGEEPIIWLDEVFANKQLQASGNLKRFWAMNYGFMRQLNNKRLAFRTINERMIAATKRDYRCDATVYEPGSSRMSVPDRRTFVVIDKTGVY